MQKFYFTFGSSATFPYQNGWIIINAEDKSSACDYFRKMFPNPRNEDIVNCAFIVRLFILKKNLKKQSCTKITAISEQTVMANLQLSDLLVI